MLTHDETEELNRFARKHNVPFVLLGDPESVVINQYGLFNTTYEPDSIFYGVPYPGVFFVDREGTIRAKFAEEQYKDRPLLDDILKTVSAHTE